MVYVCGDGENGWLGGVGRFGCLVRGTYLEKRRRLSAGGKLGQAWCALFPQSAVFGDTGPMEREIRIRNRG